jgi:hypothetical protein
VTETETETDGPYVAVVRLTETGVRNTGEVEGSERLKALLVWGSRKKHYSLEGPILRPPVLLKLVDVRMMNSGLKNETRKVYLLVNSKVYNLERGLGWRSG